MPEFLLIVGIFVFAVACRTFAHPVVRKIGALAVMVASFLIGYFIGGGSVALGVIAVATWFFLPSCVPKMAAEPTPGRLSI